MDLHQATLGGRVGAEPEEIQTKSGPLVKVPLAVHRYIGDNRPTETDWYTLQFWGNRAELGRKLSPGDRLAVVGKLKIYEYNSRGQDKTQVQLDVNQIMYHNPDEDPRKEDANE